jgi:hypothetical protein
MSEGGAQLPLLFHPRQRSIIDFIGKGLSISQGSAHAALESARGAFAALMRGARLTP